MLDSFVRTVRVSLTLVIAQLTVAMSALQAAIVLLLPLHLLHANLVATRIRKAMVTLISAILALSTTMVLKLVLQSASLARVPPFRT